MFNPAMTDSFATTTAPGGVASHHRASLPATGSAGVLTIAHAATTDPCRVHEPPGIFPSCAGSSTGPVARLLSGLLRTDGKASAEAMDAHCASVEEFIRQARDADAALSRQLDRIGGGAL